MTTPNLCPRCGQWPQNCTCSNLDPEQELSSLRSRLAIQTRNVEGLSDILRQAQAWLESAYGSGNYRSALIDSTFSTLTQSAPTALISLPKPSEERLEEIADNALDLIAKQDQSREFDYDAFKRIILSVLREAFSIIQTQ